MNSGSFSLCYKCIICCFLYAIFLLIKTHATHECISEILWYLWRVWLVGWLIVLWTLFWFFSTYLMLCSKTVLQNSLCLVPLGFIFFFRSFSFYYFFFLHFVMMLSKRVFLTFVTCISQYFKIKECFLKIRSCQNTQEKNLPWEQNCLCCDLPSIFTKFGEISIIENCLPRADNRMELNLHHLRAL